MCRSGGSVVGHDFYLPVTPSVDLPPSRCFRCDISLLVSADASMGRPKRHNYTAKAARGLSLNESLQLCKAASPGPLVQATAPVFGSLNSR